MLVMWLQKWKWWQPGGPSAQEAEEGAGANLSCQQPIYSDESACATLALKAMGDTPTDLHHCTGKILRTTKILMVGR